MQQAQCNSVVDTGEYNETKSTFDFNIAHSSRIHHSIIQCNATIANLPAENTSTYNYIHPILHCSAVEDMCIILRYNGVRNSPGKVTCPGGKQVEKVACPP